MHLALNSCPAFVHQPKGYKPSGSPQSKWSTSHMPSQVPPHVVNAYKAIEASGQEPMAKLQSAIRLFSQYGLAWEAKITPGQVLCRPDNRGGTMLNAWDAHRKGHLMMSVGINPSLLHGQSMAFTLASEPTTKQKQFEKNYQLVEASQGMLAPCQGTERYLSVASSHFVAWCRAVQASCKSSDGEVLSMDALLAGKPADDPFRKLCQEGWEWTIFDANLEFQFPGIAAWIQMTMNSTHSSLQQTTEMECLAQMAKLVSLGNSITQAQDIVNLSQPKCGHYMNAMAKFLQMYGGGDQDGFPLIQFVSNFAKSFGQSVLVGEDMFTQITYWDFRQEGQLFPVLRIALLATSLTGTKVSDGISKVLVKADLDKLKQSTMKPKVLQGEQVLANSWIWLSSKALTPERQCQLFGRLCIRVVFHLLKKEKLCAMENDVYEDLQSISDQCVKEASGIPASSAAASAAQQSEDSMDAQDLLSSKPAQIALLQHQHLKIGEKQLACVLTWICLL